MKFIKTWILRYKLAQIFKRVEQCIDLGRQPGDKVFVDAWLQAKDLVRAHWMQYSDFDARIEVPALADLEKWSIKPVPEDKMKNAMLKVKQALVLSCAASVFAGTLCALGDGTFHLWMHLFRLIGG